MRKKLIISGLSMFCFWLTACTDPFAKEEFMAYEELPIGLHLESQAQYSQWVKLLKKADLFNAINMSNVKYTCFVADNDAVDAYIQASEKWETVDDLTEEEAKNLLRYHILPTDYAFMELGSGRLGTQTASGDYLTLSLTLTDRYIKLSDDSVRILEKEGEEIPQINGYYHEVEDVLDPIIFTLMEVLEDEPNYSIFTEALFMSGLDKYLNRRDFELDGVTLRDYKAVMVVSDSVFIKHGILNIDSLKKEYKGDPTDIESEFYKFMAFHILTDAYDYGELTKFSTTSQGTNIRTYLDGEFMSLEKNTAKGDSIFLNPLGEDIDLQILRNKRDIQGCNGYIHEISGLMPLSDPVRYTFEWEPTELPEFRVLAGDFYRKERFKDGKADIFYFEEDTENLRWNTIPYKEDAVGYMSSDIEYNFFYNDDSFIANLGKVGWVEFDTPVLMRGEYNIELIKWRWDELGKGEFQMYIDGSRFGNRFNFTINSEQKLNLGNYTFSEAGSHVFRFSVTGLDGELVLDRFIFTPR